MDVVDAYLAEYGRGEQELLQGDRLNGAGIFDGEREFVELADRAYDTDQHGVFRIRAEESALLVIDMQEDLVAPEGPMCVPEAYRQVPRIKRLIQHCRGADVPVIFTEVTIPDDAPHQYRDFFPPIRAGAVSEGTPGMRVYRELAPLAGERVIDTKFGFDSFNGTPLDYVLRQRGAQTVIICGTLTNFCCETTARSAYGLGYQVVFGSDVNATDNAEAQRATLRTMRRGFGRVLDHYAIMCALDGRDEAFEAAASALGAS
ncbi:cysteine hydrolase [Saccharopolyspora sp. HNM0986]|uniref:cysteine hydrolase family protein n=1 Tax=Saccharopolyspora galaxeae TaxID=2781241 RepID=UPI00190A7DB1|nr:cysteine hydrolase [Saccharopolyspora sp. HNM0986]MBK0870371.1 cysteine hydrolase [Saccharopolyspora sp. HNM0986]